LGDEKNIAPYLTRLESLNPGLSRTLALEASESGRASGVAANPEIPWETGE